MDRPVKNFKEYIGVSVSYDEKGDIIEYLDKWSTNSLFEAATRFKDQKYSESHIDGIGVDGERSYCLLVNPAKPNYAI